MGTILSIKTAIKERAGYGSSIDDDTQGRLDDAVPAGIIEICKTPFEFLRERGVLQVVPNVKAYSLAANFGTLDDIKLSTEVNERGNVTTWTKTSGVTGQFDAAIDDAAGADSILLISGREYVIASVTGDGTAAGSVTLDYEADNGTVEFISGTSASNRKIINLEDGSFQQIHGYPSKAARDNPRFYNLDGVGGETDTVAFESIVMGDPTSDENYLVEYWHYQYLIPIADTATSLLSKIFRTDEPIIKFGLAEFNRSLERFDEANQADAAASRELGKMKIKHRYKTSNAMRA